ncbi:MULTISPECIES: hypothetical protein [unclassified Kitasatospora]|uniref:hypothetical protein n=1 Tax=unclassified Kitasatospora TaxID=2633591 RepID=UPI0033CD85FA
MIDSLTAFTVAIDYGRAHTTFLVHADGSPGPVARMHKDAAYDHSAPYQVFAGPGLGQLIGHVNNFSAIAADRTLIGRVGHRSRSWRHDVWTFDQNGLAVLEGEPVGLANKARGSLPLLGSGVVDAALPFELRYRSAESAGFELTRHAGVRATYAVRIHDPRISRLLVLACVAHFNTYGTADLRKSMVDVTANPLKA